MGAMLSLGNFDTIAGKKVLTGGSLGLNVKDIIEGTVFPKKFEIEKIEDSLSITNKKSLEFNKLSSLVEKFKASSDIFRSANGKNDDIFTRREVSVSMSSGAAAEGHLSVTARNGAPIEKFTIEVQQTAKTKIQQSWAFSSKTEGVTNDPTTPVSGEFNAGTFRINGVDITLEVGDSLSTIQDKINAKSSIANVTAKILQPEVGQYRLILESGETGMENAYTLDDPNNVLNNLFTQDPINNPDLDVQTAQDAIMIYNGNITVTRPSNKITDFIDNVSFTLTENNKPGEAVNVNIVSDSSAVCKSIIEFAESYNELTKFIQQQEFNAARKPGKDETKEEKTDRLANLKNDALVKTIKYNIKNFLTHEVEGLADHNTLASIGVIFGKKEPSDGKTISYTGILEVNPDKLDTALSENMEDVKKLFGLNFTSDSVNLSIGAKRGNNINVNSFKFDIDVNRTKLDESGETVKDSVWVTYDSPTDSSPITISAAFTPKNPADLTQGYKIEGLPGTILEDFDFSYNGSGTETVQVTLTQGLGDKVYNYISELNKEEAFTKTKNTMEKSVEKYEKEIKRKNEAMDKERKFLLEKYAKLEALFRELNSMLESLEAQQQYATK